MKRSVLVPVLLFSLSASAAADDRLPTQKAEIVLEGASAIRGMALDAAAGRVYLAHGSVVDVVDLAKGASIGTVEGVDRARGLVVLPELKRGFAVAAKKDRLLAFELETWKVLKEIPVGGGADTALYVTAVKEVWVFNQKTNDVTCVDPVSMEVKTTVKLGASPRGAVESVNMGQVFVGLVEPDGIGVVDSRSKRVLEPHPLDVGEPIELAFNAKNGLLYVGCENHQLLVLDINGWKPIFKRELDAHIGAIVYDPATTRAYVVCENATVVTTERTSKTIVRLDQGLATPGGAAAVFDAKAKKLYVAAGPAKVEEGGARILVFQ